MQQLSLDKYYNTNRETGATLKLSREKANKQDRIILKVFEHFKTALPRYKVEEVLNHRFETASVVRSINSLTNAGYLIKNGKKDMVKAPSKKRVHTWKLNETNSTTN